jgi:hypothetical protein
LLVFGKNLLRFVEEGAQDLTLGDGLFEGPLGDIDALSVFFSDQDIILGVDKLFSLAFLETFVGVLEFLLGSFLYHSVEAHVHGLWGV